MCPDGAEDLARGSPTSSRVFHPVANDPLAKRSRAPRRGVIEKPRSSVRIRLRTFWPFCATPPPALTRTGRCPMSNGQLTCLQHSQLNVAPGQHSAVKNVGHPGRATPQHACYTMCPPPPVPPPPRHPSPPRAGGGAGLFDQSPPPSASRAPTTLKLCFFVFEAHVGPVRRPGGRRAQWRRAAAGVHFSFPASHQTTLPQSLKNPLALHHSVPPPPRHRHHPPPLPSPPLTPQPPA